MHCSDYEAVVFAGEVFCIDCLPEEIDADGVDGNGDNICTPIFADSEWDTYPVCYHCGKVHDYVTRLEYAKNWYYIDYAAVLYNGCVFCHGCIPEGVDTREMDADGDYICRPTFLCAVLDYCPVCIVCGKVHDYMTLIKYINGR